MKWFTYCGNTHTGEPNWNKTRVMHRQQRRRYGGPRNYASNTGELALLLHSDDKNDPITDADVTAMYADPLTQKLFPGGYYVLPSDASDGDRILTASTEYAGLPDQAKPDDGLVQIVTEDHLHSLNLRQRYNHCLSLVKAVGCAQCPDAGITCLRREVATVEEITGQTNVDSDTCRDLFENRVTKVGPFTYISPKLTIPEDHLFVPSMRHYADHDFGRIEDNSKQISDMNKQTAVNRKFKKEQCSRCPLNGPCSSFRSCRGPYPDAEMMAATLVAGLDEQIAEGPFEPWQFWALARCGGAEGTYRVSRYRRYAVVLHGLKNTYRNWTAVMYRDKCELVELSRSDDYETLRAVFPSLPDKEKALAYPDAYSRPENNVAVALYLKLLGHSYSERHKGGWGGCNYTLHYKQLNYDHVLVQYAGPNYPRGHVELKSFADFYKEISTKMSVDQITVCPEIPPRG